MTPPVIDRAIRAVLVDDEPGARLHLAERLAEHPEIEIVGEADRAKSAIDLIQRLKPDVVFLDVQMPGGTGFPFCPCSEKSLRRQR
jgi:two-component system LytT family response regulator